MKVRLGRWLGRLVIVITVTVRVWLGGGECFRSLRLRRRSVVLIVVLNPPLLDDAPPKGLVESDMLCHHCPPCLRIEHKVSACVGGIAHQDASEGIVLEFPALMPWNMDISWTAENPEVVEGGTLACDEGDRDSVHS